MDATNPRDQSWPWRFGGLVLPGLEGLQGLKERKYGKADDGNDCCNSC